MSTSILGTTVTDGVGIVATPTDRALPETANGDGATGEAGSEEEVKVLEQRSTFDEFVVWGHETAPAADDPFVKGVEEWLKLAEAVRFWLILSLEYTDCLDEFGGYEKRGILLNLGYLRLTIYTNLD